MCAQAVLVNVPFMSAEEIGEFSCFVSNNRLFNVVKCVRETLSVLTVSCQQSFPHRSSNKRQDVAFSALPACIFLNGYRYAIKSRFG